jgi:asparagine synthase (glutamine-hydrolysing)
MCGIATILRLSMADVPPGTIETMTRRVAHRGPDGEGVTLLAPSGDHWKEVSTHDPSWRVALGHRRLSILDLSEAGHQPMRRGEHLWITYNGEAYNYLEIRQELAALGHTFQSHTDTEVLLAAYQQWGPECFARFHGMWGLVIIDTQRQIAVLCRDRIGIKPVYFVNTGQAILVASEIKQFADVAGFRLRPQKDVLADYLATGYEQQGQTFFADVTPLEPGTYLEVDLRTLAISTPRSYWFPEKIVPSITRRDEATERFRAELLAAVRLNLRSDVPVGCALSGGLDSSLVAGCIAEELKATRAQVQTFSVVFPGSKTNEQPYVDEVNRMVNAVPHLIAPTSQDFLNDVDRFTWIHDEPVGGFAQHAAYSLARLTREAGVPVTLNGQGGDEILNGYWQSYFMHLLGLFRGGRWFKLAGQFLGAAFPGGNGELWRQTPIMFRRYLARRSAAQTSAASESSAAKTLSRVLGMNEQERRVFEVRQMYLPRLLKWDDRNFMAFSVEGRYPLLDHRLIELTLSFAPSVLYDRGWIKEPIRRAAKGLIPASIVRRRTKWGFETPLDQWLSGPLREPLREWLRADSPVWEFTDRERAQKIVDRNWSAASASEEDWQIVLRLGLADRWLKVFFHTPAAAHADIPAQVAP